MFKNHCALALLILASALIGCDSGTYNQIFRNPHTSDLGQIRTLFANQEVVLQSNFHAINESQLIEVIFKGSENSELDIIYAETPGVVSHFTLNESPGNTLSFLLSVIDESGQEFDFIATGLSKGVIFRYIGDDSNIQNKNFKAIKLESTRTLNHVEVRWISYTGKMGGL